MRHQCNDRMSRLVRTEKIVNGVKLTAVMSHNELPIFEYADLLLVPKMTRLTKWLHMIKSEMAYVTEELARISSDPQRQCVIGYHLGKVALFVNDLTNGAFDGMGEECEK